MKCKIEDCEKDSLYPRLILCRKHYMDNWHFNNQKKEREYRVLNKDILKEYKKAYYKNRRKNDVLLRLRENISCTILAALKSNNNSKQGKSILKYLPYTVKELKQHLESLFEPWMTWQNHGKISFYNKTWNIDHVIPQSLLPYTSMEDDNFKKCWALDNLRPLEAIANIKKRNYPI